MTDEQLLPLDDRCRVVQFRTALSDIELERVARFLDDYPDIVLRVYGHDTCRDLDFLQVFDRVRAVQVDVSGLASIDGFRYLSPDLAYLGFGATKSTKHSLSFLARFGRLRGLWIEGHQRDFEVIAGLSDLEELSLRSVTLPNVAVPAALPRLRSFALKLGGTADLGLLASAGRVEYLEIFMVRGLSDLGAVGEMTGLRTLFLQALPQVRELPSFRRLTALGRVHLDTMKGITDLSPIAAAPALRSLSVVAMRHLPVEAFRPFVGHPTLRGFLAGLGSLRRNEEARVLVGVASPPDIESGFGRWGEVRAL